MVARTVPVPAFDLVVFGATGDLAQRKLIPALYQRLRAGQMPDDARVIGAARSTLDSESFRKEAAGWLKAHVPAAEQDAEATRKFLACLHYMAVDATSESGWSDLAALLGPCGDRVRAFYLSVAPRFFAPIAERIASSGIGGENGRIVVEKPLGHDLASARELNRELAAYFPEERIYRIDHYLGKETVQNLMALRFANALFEPLWNARHIDHVQITVAENVGVAGRGGYYDEAGAMRDMVQNHLLQLLCLTAMEPPARFEPDAVRDEKVKVLRALAMPDVVQDVVRGQYRAANGVSGYGEDAGNADSHTESFIAMKVGVDNWRWSGVPFYLRTGKRLRGRVSEITVVFRAVPHWIFGGPGGSGAGETHRNVLAIRLQPDEGITLGMTIKDPGPGGMRLLDADLDMTFAERLAGADSDGGMRMPDAYGRLVMDVIRGDQTLFMRGDEVEAAWAWIDPVIAAWQERGAKPRPYDPGSSGPEDALMLMHRDHRRWREIEA